MSASAAPSMAPSDSSPPRSTSSWLRREEAPSHSDSMESAAPICSGRSLVHHATSVRVPSAASKVRSAGLGPLCPPCRPGPGTPAGAVVWEVACSEVGSCVGPSSTTSSSAGAGSSSVANTAATSRSMLATSTPREPRVDRTSGSFRVDDARLATVGDWPTPTSTRRSTPRPPFSTLANMRSCVSIQRTGLANCQASSSTSSVRHSACGRAVQASTSARTSSRGEGPTRSATSRMKSSASENGRGTRFGT